MKKKIFYLGIILTLFSSVLFFAGCHKDSYPSPDINEDTSNNNSDDADLYYFGLQMLNISTELPHQVNVLFHVYDENGIGVPGLTSNSFNYFEDDVLMSSEASATIAPFGDIPFSIKTILLLDVSTSVQANLQQIKNAASSLIDQITTNQEVAVYTFSSNPELIVDFTSDKTILKNAINSITIGTSSSNLYGAIITTAKQIENHYDISYLEEGYLIVLTDGDDTQGSSELEDAERAVEDKNVYMLGLGNDMNVTTMQKLGKFYKADDISKLEEVFSKIQYNIQQTAKSVYWLYYQSPKRGYKNHELKIKVKDNHNTGDNSFIIGEFNSGDFGDPVGYPPSIPANPIPANNSQTSNVNVLEWSSYDLDGDPLSFDIYYGTSSNPPKIESNYRDSSYQVYAKPGNTYYWKIIVYDNNFNKVESPIWSFTVNSNYGNGVTDIDNNTYQTVIIGNQEWMAENLKVTHYPNGISIPLVTSNDEWYDLDNDDVDDAYCFFDNNSNSGAGRFGALYTHAAAIASDWTQDNTSRQGICPDGWHLPSKSEWEQLINYVGGADIAGKMLKEEGNNNWGDSNEGIDIYNFTALPSKYRSSSGFGSSKYGFWWTSDDYSDTKSFYYEMKYSSNTIYSGSKYKKYGYAIRCVKN